MCVASVRWACTPASASVIMHAVLAASDKHAADSSGFFFFASFCLDASSALLPSISQVFHWVSNTHSLTSSPRFPVAEGSFNPYAPLPQSRNPGLDNSNLATYRRHMVQADCSRTPTPRCKRGVGDYRDLTGGASY